MEWNKLIHVNYGADLSVKSAYSFQERLVGFLTLIKPPFVFMTPFNAASAAVLSIGAFPSARLCLGGFLCAFFASAGTNIFNRYADRKRDQLIWPNRAIPSGRVKAEYVLMLTVLLYIVSLILCWNYFNPITFVILLAGIILGSLYSTHLRDSIGYLSLPPIEGLIFLAGWAALAPGTIFSLTPWVLYFIGLTWQAAHIMAHYIVHIRYDLNGNPIIKTPAFFWRPSPRTASYFILIFISISFILSLWLLRLTTLNYIYLLAILAIGFLSLYRTIILTRDSRSKEKLHCCWSTLTLFKMVCAVAILLNIFVYQF